MPVAALDLIRADFGPPPAPAAQPGPQINSDAVLTGLAGYIQTCYRQARDNRLNMGVDERMMAALRAVRGEYDAQTLRDIEAFGGSKVYARIIAGKVRGCAALLREVYNSVERPWSLNPTPEPDLAGPTLDEAVKAVLTAEAQQVVAQAQAMAAQAEVVAQQDPAAAEQLLQQASELQASLNVDRLRERGIEVRDEISQLRQKQAREDLHSREDAIDDVLTEGGFYESLWMFLGDLAMYPFAVMKGPVTQNVTKMVWGNDGKPTAETKPTPMWVHCSPFDVYFAPWSQKPQDGYVIHRERLTRDAAWRLKGLSNYSSERIQALLDNWGNQNCGWYDYNESERANLEQRVSDQNSANRDSSAAPMPMLSYYGTVPRQYLVSWGVPDQLLPPNDPNVFAYLVGNEVIGVTLNPHPAGNNPFYSDSFERVPGSCYGNAIPDLLGDVASVGNAALRALVNNLSMASGPMGWVNEDRLAENDPNATKLYPWKVFRFTDPQSSAGGGSEKPMDFFQPNNNVEQLFMVYERMNVMADEISTIPRYMQGNGQGVGGAGRTAAGLSMLMEAGGRTIKQTVGSIDANVIERVVTDLNVYLSLMRPDIVQAGDISVTARGATELMQKETLRMRRLEFLNITNNPVDTQIVGVEGRFHLLRELARDLQMPIRDSIQFSEQEMDQLTEMLKAQLLMGAAGGGMNGNAPPPGGGNPNPQGQRQDRPEQQPNPAAGVARGPSGSPGR